MMLDQQRDELVRAGRSIFDRGLTFGSSGNISLRIADGYLVTPTNASLGRLDSSHLSVLNPEGSHMTGDPPTKEWPLHQAFYDARATVSAVVHLHSTHAVAVSCLADINPRDALPPLTPYYTMRVGKLPVVSYHPPGDPSLASAVLALAPESHAVLLANHGPVVAGESLEVALNRIEELEETAKLFLLLRGSHPRLLTPEEVEFLRNRWP